VTDDDVIMTCYISLGGARLHKSEFTLGRGNMGGLYKGGYGVLWGSIDKPNLSFDDNNDDVINK